MGAAGASSPAYVEDVFSTWLYTGNGSTQTITNGIDLSGKGGLVWSKSRSLTANDSYHFLCDTARGVTKYLSTNVTDAEVTRSGTKPISAFNSSGFTTDFDSYFVSNNNGSTYTSWTFRKAAKFFDVVTWTGNGVGGATVNHNLGSDPGFIVYKSSSSTGNWFVYHRSLGTGGSLNLNSTDANPGYGRVTATSSTSFTTDATGNANGATYVAYLFAHDAGGFGDSGNDSVVKCGSYTGNGSATGPVVDLGWEPQWLLIKCTSLTQPWYLIDSMRGMVVGGSDSILQPHLSDAEFTTTVLNPLPTGFQLAATANAYNGNGQTYIYIAIRRGPMKTPTDATKVFSAITASSDTTGGTTNFPVDWLWFLPRSSGNNLQAFTRLLGASNYLTLSSTGGENIGGSLSLASNTSFTGPNFGISGTIVYEAFQRAPKFCDIVAYKGTNAPLNLNHNLTIVPEMMICRQRGTNSPRNWWVYHSGVGNTKYLVLNTNAATVTLTDAWNNTTPTSSIFTLGSSSTVNQSTVPHVAYLFASCPGVSKVGTYTGTGTTLQVNCGFTAGSRFILIKRTDSTGNWYVYDSARGIVSGNDPYLLLNSTAGEITGTDYVDTYNAGFEISSTAPADINANGGTFIFLAVA